MDLVLLLLKILWIVVPNYRQALGNPKVPLIVLDTVFLFLVLLKHKGIRTMDDFLLPHTVLIMPTIPKVLLKWAVNKRRYQNGPDRIQNRIDVKTRPDN